MSRSAQFSGVRDDSNDTIDLLVSHTNRLVGLLDAYESLRVRAFVGIAGLSTVSLITTAVAIIGRLDLFLFRSSESSYTSSLALGVGLLSAVIGVAATGAILYSQYKRRWILDFQIRLTSDALDKLVSYASTDIERLRSTDNSNRIVLMSIQVAEAKAVLQHATQVDRLGRRLAAT